MLRIWVKNRPLVPNVLSQENLQEISASLQEAAGIPNY